MAKIFGQLERAQLEVLGADPSGAGLVQGRVWFNTATGFAKYYDGSSVQSLKPDDLGVAMTATGANAIINDATYAGSTFLGKWAGTTTNDSAAAGLVGEYFSASEATPTACSSTGTFGDVESLPLTAGDWDITLVVEFLLNGATCTAVRAALSENSGNTTTDHVDGDNVLGSLPPSSTARSSITIAGFRKSLAGNTTIYGKVLAVFSAGTPQYVGRISARRVR